MTVLHTRPPSKTVKIPASLGIISISFLMIFSFLLQAHAQSSGGNRQVFSPQQMLCPQIERYGGLTDGSVVHQHDVTMTLAGSSDNQYVYSGYGKNGKNEGSGQSFNATYNSITGRLINESDGINCPSILSQAQYDNNVTPLDPEYYTLPTYQYPHTLPRTYDPN